MAITKLGDVARTRHIYDVVGSYGFELQSAGRDKMQTRCPRPYKGGKDTRPSLTLYDDSQRFYCFGCLWWGDSLDFIQEMERLSLQEAANRLQRNHLPLMKDRPKPPKRQRNPRRDGVLVAAAVGFYSHTLQGARGRARTDVLPRSERGQGNGQDAADRLRRRRAGEASDRAGLLSRRGRCARGYSSSTRRNASTRW